MKVIGSPLEMHGEDQTHQTKVVVAMKMTNEDVIDPVEVSLELHQLHLSAFAAVDEKIMILYFNQLSGRMSAIRWQCTARTQYGYLETHSLKQNDQNRLSFGHTMIVYSGSVSSSRRLSDPFRFRA
jgi:hypothetical protein